MGVGWKRTGGQQQDAQEQKGKRTQRYGVCPGGEWLPVMQIIKNGDDPPDELAEDA
ncbi:hypothetical protein KSF_086050 [Reticulibacter mediterranei]|uniref:Uncharacterized protein n=1 Tax=Reticulibacter mediterranei TaxID=2778369 RepID=A0A8J3N4T6_9CHLR|nr:hypothetical protein KSF_086050 [Reticulibacter mediterranei]